MTKVAVVIPTLNAQRYLAESIDSMLAQTFTDFSVYVVDGGSSDITGDIVAAYAKKDSRVHFVHRPGLNPAERFNLMMRELDAKFVVVAHADDFSMPHRLSVQIDYMRTHPDCIVCGSAVNFWEHERRGTSLRNHTGTLSFPVSHDEIVTRLPFWWCFCNASLALNRNLFVRSGLCWKSELKVGADWLFYWEASKVGRVHNLPDVLLWWRQHHMSEGASHINEITSETFDIRKIIADDLGFLEDLSANQKKFTLICASSTT